MSGPSWSDSTTQRKHLCAVLRLCIVQHPPSDRFSSSTALFLPMHNVTASIVGAIGQRLAQCCPARLLPNPFFSFALTLPNS
jgi:hypothetical protein